MTNPDGRLRFTGENDTTKTLTLPADGTWVPFSISGQTRSAAVNDAIVEAHKDQADGPVLGTEDMTVFYIGDATFTMTQGGAYQLLAGPNDTVIYAPQGVPAVTYEATAKLKPDGLECPGELADCGIPYIGFTNNVIGASFQVDYSFLRFDPDPAAPPNQQCQVPSKMQVLFDIPQAQLPMQDVDAAASDPLQSKADGWVDLPSPCGKGPIKGLDTPSLTFPRLRREDCITTGGVKLATAVYEVSRMVMNFRFRLYLVTYDQTANVICAVKCIDWSVSVDSNLANQKATTGQAADCTSNPKTGAPFINDYASDPAHHSIAGVGPPIPYTS